MSPQTALEGLKRDRPLAVRSQAAGMRMMTTTRAMMLNVLPALLTRAIQRVGIEAMQPWINIIKTVSRKVWYSVGT